MIMLSLNMVQHVRTFAVNTQPEVKTPKSVKVYKESKTSLKLRWKSVTYADGYVIYKYDKSKKRYKILKEINNRNHTEWIDKGLQTNKVFKYKIAAYKKVDNVKYYSKRSKYVKAKTYKKDAKKTNSKAPKVSNKKVYLGLCSSKKIKASVSASKYGTNKNKKAFSTKVRWYSSNTSIAKVNKSGKITAGAKVGKCYVYAVAHNGAKTRITVVVKNYAKPKNYYNCWEEDDLYTLVYDYTNSIQNIAEYFSINRLKENEKIKIELNDDAEVVITPKARFDEKINKEIENLLVNFPYYISIKIYEDRVEFISKKEDEKTSLSGYVRFWFNDDCSAWSTQIASHWEAVRFYPD